MNWFSDKLKEEGVYLNSGENPINELCSICNHKRDTHLESDGSCPKCQDTHKFEPSGNFRVYGD